MLRVNLLGNVAAKENIVFPFLCKFPDDFQLNRAKILNFIYQYAPIPRLNFRQVLVQSGR